VPWTESGVRTGEETASFPMAQVGGGGRNRK
jgi:hypothetical protein